MGTQNPSFESPGLEAGQADQWTEVCDDGAEDYAQFSTSKLPFDDFAEWYGNQFWQTEWDAWDLYPALFERGAHITEGFESSWCMPHSIEIPPRFNHLFKTEFTAGDTELAGFNAAADAYEGFEQDWDSNQLFETYYGGDGATSTAASFDGAPVEDFEDGWWSNENYQTAFGGGDITSAMFDFGARAYEPFMELSWPGLIYA